MKNNHYFTIKQLAKKANINPLTIAFKIAMKEIQVDHIGSKIYIPDQEAHNFIAKIKAQRKGQTYLALS